MDSVPLVASSLAMLGAAAAVPSVPQPWQTAAMIAAPLTTLAIAAAAVAWFRPAGIRVVALAGLFTGLAVVTAVVPAAGSTGLFAGSMVFWCGVLIAYVRQALG